MPDPISLPEETVEANRTRLENAITHRTNNPNLTITSLRFLPDERVLGDANTGILVGSFYEDDIYITERSFELWYYHIDSMGTYREQRISRMYSNDYQYMTGDREPPFSDFREYILAYHNTSLEQSFRELVQSRQDSELNTFFSSIDTELNSFWPPCDLCNRRNCPNPNNGLQHNECSSCSLVLNNNTVETLSLGTVDCQDPEETIHVCFTCYDSGSHDSLITWCTNTDRPVWSDYIQERDLQGYTRPFCQECYNHRIDLCDNCNVQIFEDSWIVVGEDEYFCRNCAADLNLVGMIHSWDYRPELIFHPTIPKDPKKPLYIGLELETSFRNIGFREYLTQWITNEDLKDLIYIKSDSSVANGLEIVTHPMQPDWALEHFPFHRFDQLIEEANAFPSHESCGTHIHMNKEAFSKAHMWKLLQLHWRLPEFCGLVGGRGTSAGFGSFQLPDWQAMRTTAKDLILSSTSNEVGNFHRYVAINLRNEYTMELRYPAGGSDATSIRKNIEWSKAIYDFSHFISVEEVKTGVLNDPGYLLWWIHNGNYPTLSAFIQSKIPSLKPLERAQ